MFFLTELDPKAAVKGSRDPLGIQPIWMHFGRSIIGNLTTVTTSLRNFTVLLLGLHFADRVIADGKADEAQRADIFLKFEQLAAYSRFAKLHDDEPEDRILGINRIRRRFSDGEPLRISARRDAQILSNQKTYGIWGLYSVAGRASGYSDDDNRLTGDALALVEHEYLPRLTRGAGKDGRDLVRLLTSDAVFEPKGRHDAIAGALARVLRSGLTTIEREFYAETLVLRRRGAQDATDGRQAAFWDLLREARNGSAFTWDSWFSYPELCELAKRAAASGRDDLAAQLSHIATVEPVLAAVRRLFVFLLQREGQPLEKVAEEVRSVWGASLEHLRPDDVRAVEHKISRASDPDSAARFVAMADLLHSGNYAAAIEAALAQNAAVMASRGGFPWITLEGGRLKVRMREDAVDLPDVGQLPTLWTNTYFIDSLAAIGHAVFTEAA